MNIPSQCAPPHVDLAFKWRGENYKFPAVNLSATSFSDLKEMIEDSTSVLTTNQKILGLTKVSPKDGVERMLSELQLTVKDGVCSFSLIGTPETEIRKMHEQQAVMETTSSVFDDLAFGLSSNTEEWQQLQEYTVATNVNFINEPRSGKGLLVLDLDHTIVHFTSKENVPIEEQKRPFMDQFLADVYDYFDIALWSQTRWHWIEIKMNEMSMFDNPNYKVCFILDRNSMFNGAKGKVKPLHLIWAKFPTLWGKHNTIHIDDLARNFQLNPRNGIVVRPYNRANSSAAAKASKSRSSRDGSQTRENVVGVAPSAAAPSAAATAPLSATSEPPTQDIDLYVLSRYLIHIAESKVDMSCIDHSNWFADDKK